MIFSRSDPDEYNDIMQRSFLAAVKADGGVYSEPISLVNLLCEWRKVSKDSSNQRQINNWLRENNVVRARIQQFDGIAKNLARTVTSVLSRIDNRIESNRIPRYDLSGWLAMQEDTVSIGSAPSSVSPSLPFLDDDDIADIALDIEFMRDEINEGNSEMLAKLDAVADLRIDMSSATEQAKEITACRLNLCRLILVWSSDGFLLNQSRKMKVAANYYDTIRLGDKYLKNDQLKSLFPVDVPWEISYSGTRIYDGKVHGEQCLDVFHRMCEVGILMSDCRYDATAPTHGTWSCSLVSDAQPPIIWISVVLNNKKTTIFFALPDSTSRQVLEAIFSGGKFEKTLDKHGIYDVYSVVGASKKELTNLGLSRSVLSRTMTITIPATGNSKLTVCGCEPNFGDLSCIFDIDEAAIHAKQSREIENSDRSLPPGISVQIFDKNCVLKFPSERNVLANPYHFSNSIISDYPIGMRLFNSYKSSRYKEK